jgi:hypothetical protein
MLGLDQRHLELIDGGKKQGGGAKSQDCGSISGTFVAF